MAAHAVTSGEGMPPGPRAIRSLCGAAALSCIGTDMVDRLWSRPWNAGGVARRHAAANEVLRQQRIGVSAIQFDHQWEDIDVEA